VRCPLDLLTVRGSCSHLRSAPCGKQPGVPVESIPVLGLWKAAWVGQLQDCSSIGLQGERHTKSSTHCCTFPGESGVDLERSCITSSAADVRCLLDGGVLVSIILVSAPNRSEWAACRALRTATETLLTADFFRDELHGEEQWKFMAAQERKMPERKSDLLPLVMVSTDWRTLPDAVAFVGSVVLVCFSLAAGDRSFSLVSRTMPGEVMDSTSRARLPLDAAASSLPNCSKKATRERTDIFNTTQERQSCRCGVELVDSEYAKLKQDVVTLFHNANLNKKKK